MLIIKVALKFHPTLFFPVLIILTLSKIRLSSRSVNNRVSDKMSAGLETILGKKITTSPQHAIQKQIISKI
jgi:hypothetical protein